METEIFLNILYVFPLLVSVANWPLTRMSMASSGVSNVDV